MSDEHTADLQTFIEAAIARKATDIFLIPGEPPAYRVDRNIERTQANPLVAEQVDRLALAAIGEERVRQIGAQTGVAYAAVRLSDGSHCSVSVARSGGRLSIWARPMASFTFQAHQIRVPEPVLRAIEEPGGGLVVVTGLMGCGKTTTCYALIEHLNATRDVHIVMAEYYCEYAFEAKRALIQQRQVGLDAPDMATAIHSALIQDADVLFVGEIRDVDVLSACLNAPESGRRVLTQLHQPTPEAAIRRIIALQPEEARCSTQHLLARHLRAVLAQTLLPRADGRGRVPAYGVLIPDKAMREAIAAGRDPLDRSSSLPSVCQTLADDMNRLQRDGLVTAQAAQEAIASV